MSIKTITIEKKITPRIAIYKRDAFDILEVDPEFMINKYEITLKESKVVSLKLFALHPNCNPDTGEFCLGPDIIENQANEYLLEKVIPYTLSVYNLDSCYFRPKNGKVKYGIMK
jgi:hypothetical protein